MFPLFHGVKQIWVSHMECSLHARLSLEIAPWNEPDRMVILLFIVYFDTQNSFDDSFLLRNSRLEKARWSHNTCHMMRFMRFLCFHNTIANNGAAKTCYRSASSLGSSLAFEARGNAGLHPDLRNHRPPDSRLGEKHHR